MSANTPRNQPRALVDCGCETTTYPDGSGVEIHFCPLHGAAEELATHLAAACEALDLARTGCGCSVAERASGHHIDCYVPQIKETLEAARTAIAKARP